VALMVYAYAILEQAAEIDAAEDEQFGDRRGDELPPALSTREGRQLWLRDAQRRLDQRRADAIAAAVTISSAEFGQLEPMVAATETELAASGVTDTPEVVLADAGYWHSEQIERLTAAAPSCSSRPTPASARAPGRAGTAVCTRSCAACSRPNAAASSTADATS
jgi:hypothetical protein